MGRPPQKRKGWGNTAQVPGEINANDLEWFFGGKKRKRQRAGGRHGRIVLSPCIDSPASQMQGQQQEHQPHASTLTPQKKRGEEKSSPRTHQNRLFFSAEFFTPGLFLPPQLPPGEGAREGKVWEGDTPPDQVGCDSRRNGAGANRTERMLA